MPNLEGGVISCLGKLYDIFAQSISILDVTTDIIVCVEFYTNDRMIFFTISLCILILALFGYVMAFMNKFSDEYLMCHQFMLFLTLIPISPCIPFIFYYVDYDNSLLARFFEDYWCFSLSFGGSSTSRDASKFKQFFESKVDKHLGFILESLVEAILQMTAIVMFEETNIIAIISILISLLSVASKSLVFSFGASSNFKQLAFNWLCGVTDFFGIFFVVCWVFYEPNDAYLNDAFLTIQTVWLYKLYIFQFPMIAFVSIVLHLLAVSVLIYDNGNGVCQKTCVAILGFLLVTFCWICGLIASVLIFEIASWTWIAGTFLFLGSKRLPTYHKLSLQFWWTLMSWINSARKHHIGSKYKGCTSYTKKQDKMMRLASVNYIVGKGRKCNLDDTLMKYLEYHQNDNQYMNVTMQGLRCNTANKDESQFVHKFWRWYSTVWRTEAKNPGKRVCKTLCLDRRCPADAHDCCLALFFDLCVTASLTFVFGPIYFISRFVTLLFPAFIVFYLYFGYGINIWNTDSIHIFQIVMITIYMVLCIILSILFYSNIKEQYLMAHLLPSKKKIQQLGSGEKEMELRIKEVMNHYYGIVTIPIRRAMIIERFGPDLGPIIISFLPTDDNFENVGQVVTVQNVV